MKSRHYAIGYRLSRRIHDGTGMEDSARHRRAELIEEIRRHGERLEVLNLLDRCAPSLVREDAANHKQEIAEKLRLLNEELHALNLQLIREGLSANQVDPAGIF